MDIKMFEKMLQDFKNLKPSTQKTRRQTFMTVSGYPHIENVASNVLSFLFNDTEEHGLGNLWIRSLLECIDYDEAKNVNNSWCNREVSTLKGNRIDLVIYSDTVVVTLENKLFSGVHNDLKDYSKTVKTSNKDNLIQIDVLLTLFDEHAIADKNSFKNVTYFQLFEKVRSNLGEYLDSADNTWLLYMKDFMYTIEGLVEGDDTNMDKEFARFLHDNNDEIVDFVYKLDAHKRELKKETEKICGLLELNDMLSGYKYSRFCYNTKWTAYSSICIDIVRPDKRILTVETFVDADGWHVTLFDRKGQTNGKNEIQQRLKDKKIPFDMPKYESDKTQVAWCEYGVDTSDVMEAIYKGVTIALQII